MKLSYIHMHVTCASALRETQVLEELQAGRSFSTVVSALLLSMQGLLATSRLVRNSTKMDNARFPLEM